MILVVLDNQDTKNEVTKICNEPLSCDVLNMENNEILVKMLPKFFSRKFCLFLLKNRNQNFLGKVHSPFKASSK